MDRRHRIEAKIRDNVLPIFNGMVINGISSPCHEWQGSDSGKGRGGGYPRMSLDGQTVAVHLVVFTHHFGFIPGKKQIDHLCNNRLCVNPDHLQMVTHKKNQILRAKRAKERTSETSITDHGILWSHVSFPDALSGNRRPTHLQVLGVSQECSEAHFEDDGPWETISADVPAELVHQA